MKLLLPLSLRLLKSRFSALAALFLSLPLGAAELTAETMAPSSVGSAHKEAASEESRPVESNEEASGAGASSAGASSGNPSRQASPVPSAQVVEDEITVSGGRPAGSQAPASSAATALQVGPAETAPPTVAELVSRTPGVSQNGQGGLFQVFSIRGISRQRVQTRLDGARLTSERRAGVSASFVDAQLLDSIDILRGPSSSFYGSGALGGLVQLFPRRFQGTQVTTGYDSQGDERYAAAGWGNRETGWSLGIAHREADDDETADGERRFSAFSQTSAVLRKDWGDAERSHSLLVVPTFGEDIGKANTDFPERSTTYPRERHLVVRYRQEVQDRWSLEAYIHPQDLQSRTATFGQGPLDRDQLVADNLVENESFDLGGRWQRPWHKGPLEGRYGVEYFGRRGVSATERELTFGAPSPGLPTPVPVLETVSRTLDDGSVDEAAAHGSAAWSWGAAQLEAGARYTWIRQDNRGADALEDTAWSGFLGAVIPLAPGFEAVANVGTGLRFPSLSERFFSGTTGRGTITANPDLQPERSLSFDAGLRHYGHNTFFAVYGFRTEIDDYIERVEIRPDELGFVNLFSGTIEGIEVEVLHTVTRHLRLQASAHTMRGRSGTGEALEDIPGDRIEAGALWDRGRWRLDGLWQHRFAKDDPGSGERPRAAADVVSASLGYRLTDDLTLTLRGDNLLDELYFSTADRKDVPAPGRSVGLALGWRAR